MCQGQNLVLIVLYVPGPESGLDCLVRAIFAPGPPTPLLSAYSSGFRVQGSGFQVQGSWYRVQGSGFRVQGPHEVKREASLPPPPPLYLSLALPASVCSFVCVAPSLFLAFSNALYLSFTHNLSRALSLALSLSLSRTLSLPLSLSHTHTLSLSREDSWFWQRAVARRSAKANLGFKN